MVRKNCCSGIVPFVIISCFIGKSIFGAAGACDEAFEANPVASTYNIEGYTLLDLRMAAQEYLFLQKEKFEDLAPYKRETLEAIFNAENYPDFSSFDVQVGLNVHRSFAEDLLYLSTYLRRKNSEESSRSIQDDLRLRYGNLSASLDLRSERYHFKNVFELLRNLDQSKEACDRVIRTLKPNWFQIQMDQLNPPKTLSLLEIAQVVQHFKSPDIKEKLLKELSSLAFDSLSDLAHNYKKEDVVFIQDELQIAGHSETSPHFSISAALSSVKIQAIQPTDEISPANSVQTVELQGAVLVEYLKKLTPDKSSANLLIQKLKPRFRDTVLGQSPRVLSLLDFSRIVNHFEEPHLREKLRRNLRKLVSEDLSRVHEIYSDLFEQLEISLAFLDKKSIKQQRNELLYFSPSQILQAKEIYMDRGRFEARYFLEKILLEKGLFSSKSQLLADARNRGYKEFTLSIRHSIESTKQSLREQRGDSVVSSIFVGLLKNSSVEEVFKITLESVEALAEIDLILGVFESNSTLSPSGL